MTDLRIKPSGYVHDWRRRGQNWWVSRCGMSRLWSRLTDDFPPGCRRCPDCFPKKETQ
jgi:hypothetical protein